ncbi:MAG: hypothetical protein KKF54_08940 [Candidatus Omnitrophica bacterium]|nr:hypothetical protein [Candidatus Omnitrophota bacterium]
MKKIIFFIIVAILLIIGSWLIKGQSEQGPWAKFKKSIEATDDIIERYAEFDMALPVSEDEYCGLKGNAIVMVTAVSEHQSELPLKRTYFQIAKGKEIELTKLIFSSGINNFAGDKITKTKFADGEKDCYVNLSFWLLPVSLLQDEKGVLAIDFKERRKAFVLYRGPWKIDDRNKEYVRKQLQDKMKGDEQLNSDLLGQFIEREFIK